MMAEVMPDRFATAASDQLGRAFADPVLAAQRCFRAILSAMSEPGRVFELADEIEAPPGLEPATARVLLALADPETRVWLAPSLASAAPYIRFHCSAPTACESGGASFAVIDGSTAEPGLMAFDAGDDRYPDRSATVIVQCTALTGGAVVTLSGPGIRGSRAIAPAGLRGGFWQEAICNYERTPLGIDLILAAGDSILCMPRSTRITHAH